VAQKKQHYQEGIPMKELAKKARRSTPWCLSAFVAQKKSNIEGILMKELARKEQRQEEAHFHVLVY